MNIYNFIINVIKANKIKTFILALIMMTSSLIPAFTHLSIRWITSNFYSEELNYYLVIFFICIVGMSLTYAFEEIVKQLITYQTMYFTFRNLFTYTLSHSYSFFLKVNSGKLSAHTNKISNFPMFFLFGLRIIFLFIPVLFSILFFIYLNYVLSIFLLSWFILFISITMFFFTKQIKYNQNIMKLTAEINSNLNEIMKNTTATFSYFNTEREIQRNEAFIKEIQKNNRNKFIILLIYEIIFIIGMITIFSGIIYINKIFQAPLEDIIFSISNSFSIFWRSCHISYCIPELLDQYSTMSFSFKELFTKTEEPEKNKIKNLHFQNSSIKISKLNFQYNTKLILKNISLYIQPKEKIAIVGPSGSGKTTLISLIMKLLKVEDKSIFINNTDINLIHKNDVMNNISLVSQNIQLMSRTIRENISGSLPKLLTDTELDEICKNAQCYDFISKLPAKYDTKLVECGVNLSGGEKQRIAIARALAKNGSIIIFDEANSALDNITNRKFQDIIFKLFHDKTCIFISHKLKYLEKLDKIVFINKGEIKEFGSHKELINKKGEYYSLYKT